MHGSYWFYRRGLVSQVEPLSRDVTVDQLIAENEKLFSRYHPPAAGAIKSKSLEPSIPAHYATSAVVVGEKCMEIHYDSQARAWFKRALALDPSMVQVGEVLDKMGNEK